MIMFATITVGLSLLTLVSMFLVKLATADQRSMIRIRATGQIHHYDRLWIYFVKKFKSLGGKIWRFILEAKDLKPATTKTFQTQVERVKSVFRIRIRSNESDPHWLPEAADLGTKLVASQNPEDLYLAAIQKNPVDRQAYEGLGRLYLQNKNYIDALEIYQFLIRLDPEKDIYYSNLGLSHFSLKEYQKAVAAYEKALNINSKIPTRWINLSLCFEALEDYPRTVKAITQALNLDRMNVNYLMMLADSYLKIPNNVRAEEILEQILGLEPTNRVAREKLMRLKI